MDQQLLDQLNLLRLPYIKENWEQAVHDATRKKPSYHRFLADILAAEAQRLHEQRRIARIKSAKIPEALVMETFPFSRQPRLDKRKVMDLYDSRRFLTESQALIFIGPTGCGKSGLGTAFLIHAINNNSRGRFIDFKELLELFHQSMADRSERRLIRQLSALDCLLIDEVGYSPLDKHLAGLFFDLIKMRHRKHCTIITTQLGFAEWPQLMGNEHLCAALIDRITENCTVFNMSSCLSIRPKKIVHAANNKVSDQNSGS